MTLSSSHTIHYLLLALGAFAGVLMTAQLVQPAPSTVDPFEPLQELDESIAILSQEQVELQESIGTARGEIEKLESVTVNTDRKKKLSDLKEQLGLTEVSGSGIEILLDDSIVNRPILADIASTCYAADLRDLVNVLRVAGATAIAVNGQRVIYSTSVVCVGQSVLVNNVRMLPPFTVMAISPEENPKFISYLKTEKFIPDLYQRVRNEEVTLKVTEQDDLAIPRYKGNLETSFIK